MEAPFNTIIPPSDLALKNGMDKHSLRSSLSVIMSTVELIEKHYLKGNTEECLNRLANIKLIVKDIVETMDVSQDSYSVFSGVTYSYVTDFELREFLEDICYTYKNYLKEDQSLHINMVPEELHLFQNEKILYAVLTNLIQNAIKYSPEGSSISINVSVEDRLKISVVDEGIGIPESEKIKIFKKYYRASNTGDYSGRGVGLYQIKKYLEFLNGCITVHDNANKGTVFSVYLDYSLRN
ncbi:MAG: hypothetical protein CR968_05510 [Flavobacteriia bacterium]|nr:MAG: hypothetical protein CR968_05510 [Flavobacteriia bacterium]